MPLMGWRMVGWSGCLLLSLSAMGCNRGDKFAQNPQVEGIVRLNGQPVPNARVEFVPIDSGGSKAQGSGGATDDAGRFKLICDNKKPGAILGKHRVVILQGRSGGSHDRDQREPAVGQVPKEYTIASSTPLEMEVTADKHDYPIDITSTPVVPLPPVGKND